MKFKKGDYIADGSYFINNEVNEEHIYQVVFVNSQSIKVKHVCGWHYILDNPDWFESWEKVMYYKNSPLWKNLNESL